MTPTRIEIGGADKAERRVFKVRGMDCAEEVAVLKDGRLIDRFSTEALDGSQGLALKYQECLR